LAPTKQISPQIQDTADSAINAVKAWREKAADVRGQFLPLWSPESAGNPEWRMILPVAPARTGDFRFGLAPAKEISPQIQDTADSATNAVKAWREKAAVVRGQFLDLWSPESAGNPEWRIILPVSPARTGDFRFGSAPTKQISPQIQDTADSAINAVKAQREKAADVRGQFLDLWSPESAGTPGWLIPV
jgi:NAD(P)H-flavin reductase